MAKTEKAGAVSRGAVSAGAVAIGALALGGLALGFVAIGGLAIGRLAIGRARVRRLVIDELVVGRITLADQSQGGAPEPKRDVEKDGVGAHGEAAVLGWDLLHSFDAEARINQ